MTDTERLALQTRRLKRIEAWARKMYDRHQRINTRDLWHRLKQAIDAGEKESQQASQKGKVK